MADPGMKGWHDLVDKQIKRPLLNLHIEPHRRIIDERINPHGFIGFKLFDDGIRAAKEQIGLKAFGINPDIPVKFSKRDSSGKPSMTSPFFSIRLPNWARTCLIAARVASRSASVS